MLCGCGVSVVWVCCVGVGVSTYYVHEHCMFL